jgi:hypothetical protein
MLKNIMRLGTFTLSKCSKAFLSNQDGKDILSILTRLTLQEDFGAKAMHIHEYRNSGLHRGVQRLPVEYY